MHKFFRNFIITAIVAVCGIALYQARQATNAEYFDGVVVTSVSSGYLTYTGTDFVVQYVALSSLTACGPTPDMLYAYLSDSINSGTLSGKPLITGTVCSSMTGRTGTINVSTTYQSFTGSTLYLHIIVKDNGGTTKGYGEQEITFVASGGGGMSHADRAALYTGTIYSAVLSGGINSNLNTVTAANVTGFSGLYFEAPGSGKLVLLSTLDLESGAVQYFLQHIPSYLTITNGFVAFTPTGSGASLNVQSQIYMYYTGSVNIPSSVTANINNIIVKDGSGNILASSGMVSSFVCGLSGGYNVCGFTAPHFTSFEMRPWLASVNITSSNGTGAWSGHIISLSFTGSEALTGVSVTIAGNTANLQGSGTSWYASGLLITGGTIGAGVPFTIDFRNYAGTSGNQVTGTSDSSYVNYRLASTDATLSALSINTGTLSPTFASGTTSYTVTYPYSFTGTVTITGTKNHTYASISSGSYSLSLPTAGSTGSMFITVRAEDNSTKTYTVNIARAAASTDATLSTLTAVGGTLSPTFASGTTGYTINLAYSFTGTVSITGAKNHAYASIISGTTSLNLSTVGSTGTMFITVQAEGGNTNTYTVNITRAAASTDATLSVLSTSTGTLSPTFASGTTSYTINLPYSQVGTLTITGTKNHTYASISSGSYSLALTIGSTGTLFITVQAEGGNTNTYTVNVTRAAASTDATLNILTPSTGTLSPGFASGVTGYTLNFPYSYTGSVNITGTKNHQFATVTSGIYSNTLTVGSTGTMFITVTAENNSTKTYTVTITRTPASTDANLSSLTLSTGTLSPTFSSGTTSYTVQMLYSYIGTITSTPLASNAYATLSGITSLNLSSAGSTGSLSTLVTAEDGTTTKTYTIGFTRSTPPAITTTSINGTVTVTGGSADLSGATSTGATFTSTGTLHIVGDTTNDYIELSVSGVIITASGGTRDGVLLAPSDLISGDSNNATTTELGLSSSTNTVLLTVQAGSNTDSLTVTGGYFNLSFVVPGGTAGNVLKLYRSENGSTWTANTPDATCTLTAGLVCSFRTDHLSYFTTVKETTTSGGGGGGGGSSATTYGTGDTTTNGTISRGSGNIAGSTYPDEWNFAYLYAYDLGITTMKTVQQANMEGNLIRAHMAKMMVNYAIKILHKTIDTGANCSFGDLNDQSTEMKLYIKYACQLGLMGIGIDNFDPNGEVTRAQFGTVLSRALYGNENNTTGELYYLNHLNTLKSNNIITNTDPYLKEIRGYVMLMLYRAQ